MPYLTIQGDYTPYIIDAQRPALKERHYLLVPLLCHTNTENLVAEYDRGMLCLPSFHGNAKGLFAMHIGTCPWWPL